MPRTPPKKKKRSPKEPTWSDEEMCAALFKCRGLVSLAAKKLGCSQPLIYARAKNCPEMHRIIKYRRLDLLDTAEDVVWDKIETERDADLAWKILHSRIADKRGWTEIKRVHHGEDKKAPLPVQPQVTVNALIGNLSVEAQLNLLQALEGLKPALGMGGSDEGS